MLIFIRISKMSSVIVLRQCYVVAMLEVEVILCFRIKVQKQWVYQTLNSLLLTLNISDGSGIRLFKKDQVKHQA